MGNALAWIWETSIRSVLIGGVWIFGAFAVAPLAVAWEHQFSVPLWTIVALAGCLPLLVEFGLLWLESPDEDLVELGRTTSPMIASRLGDGVPTPTRRGPRKVRECLGCARAPHRRMRFGRTRLR